MFPDMNTLYM